MSTKYRTSTFIALIVGLAFCTQVISAYEPWSYECDPYKRCVKTDIKSNVANPLGMNECKMVCDDHALFWPQPRNFKSKGAERTFTTTHPDNIVFANKDYYQGTTAGTWIDQGIQEQIEWLRKKKPGSVSENPSQNQVQISFYFSAGSTDPTIRKDTDESYNIDVAYDNKESVNVNITSDNYFGARHALETLFQAMEFEDVRNSFIIMTDFIINDHPEFSHRGISLDTSRNFMTVPVIKRIIDGMAASKLNVLHWHITDTHSFPLEVLGDKVRQMTQYGAYDSESYYSQEEVRDIVGYANKRGVRVIPELDQPAHVGNGWNFPGGESLTVCTNKEPWFEWCVEPPCGQLNPAEPKIYDILGELYEEFYDLFKFDAFHMGADEVNFDCWNSSEAIRNYMTSKGWDLTKDGFVSLWSEFQQKSKAKLLSVNQDTDIIIWTCTLTTPEYIHRISNSDYIVQIWTFADDFDDPQIETLAENGFRMIFSNVDASYLDCGYGAWIGEGNNWCSPYKGWQLMYGNDPYAILQARNISLTQEMKDLVLGSEVAMWSEQVDSNTVEGKIFPRASSMAERLWSNPQNDWYQAETRILHHRQTLTEQRGIRADALQPEWCMRNGGQCYAPEDDPGVTPEPSTTEKVETTTTKDGAQPQVRPSIILLLAIIMKISLNF